MSRAGGLHGRAAQGGRLLRRAHARAASGVPVGLGEPLFDKLDADIAYAMMGINAVKGVEIGAGFASVASAAPRTATNSPRGLRSNNAGGVLGGISTGQDLEVSIAIKPTSSILSPARVDRHPGQPTDRWSPRAATTPAWASAPRRSPRPCWRWC
jgi:chorismate synthase